MNTVFVACFIAGFGLSVVSALHMPRFVRLPKLIRHAAPRKGKSEAVNIVAITAFLVWFGGGGLLLEQLLPWPIQLITGGASAIGLAGGALINSAIAALAKRESNAQPLSMIGVIGKTVVAIRESDGTGEIVFTHAGTRRVAGARSESGRAVPKGTEVVVTRYEKGIAYVATWDELEKG